MAVQPHSNPPRSTWTDERLDDLAQAMRDGFARNDSEHRLIRQEIREGFARTDTRFDELQASLNGRFDRLQTTIVAGLIAIIATMIGNGLGIF